MSLSVWFSLSLCVKIISLFFPVWHFIMMTICLIENFRCEARQISDRPHEFYRANDDDSFVTVYWAARTKIITCIHIKSLHRNENESNCLTLFLSFARSWLSFVRTHEHTRFRCEFNYIALRTYKRVSSFFFFFLLFSYS